MITMIGKTYKKITSLKKERDIFLPIHLGNQGGNKKYKSFSLSKLIITIIIAASIATYFIQV